MKMNSKIGDFLIKAKKKDFTNMRNLGKERTFIDVFDRLKQKSKPGKIITIVVNKNASERSPLKNLKVNMAKQRMGK